VTAPPPAPGWDTAWEPAPWEPSYEYDHSFDYAPEPVTEVLPPVPPLAGDPAATAVHDEAPRAGVPVGELAGWYAFGAAWAALALLVTGKGFGTAAAAGGGLLISGAVARYVLGVTGADRPQTGRRRV
jgi:hypothetical protein